MRALKLLLDSMGVKINPEEIETAWTQSKDALPKLAAAFDEMNARLARVEKKVDLMYATQNDFNTRMANAVQFEARNVA
jgi:hypothetical protein